jgi:hypothetical protein
MVGGAEACPKFSHRLGCGMKLDRGDLNAQCDIGPASSLSAFSVKTSTSGRC